MEFNQYGPPPAVFRRASTMNMPPTRSGGMQKAYSIKLKPRTPEPLADNASAAGVTPRNGVSHDHADPMEQSKTPAGTHSQPTGYTESLDILSSRQRIIDDGDAIETILNVRVPQNNKDLQGSPTSLKWIHLHQHNAMDLEGFRKVALQQPGLSDDDKLLLHQSFVKARRREIATIDSRYFRYLQTGAFEMSGTTGMHDGPDIGYTTTGSPNSTILHPIRTLLQSQYDMESTERQDQEKVRKQQRKMQDSRIVHVAQLWVIMLGKNLLFTCANLSLSQILGKTIVINYDQAGVGKVGCLIKLTNAFSNNSYSITLSLDKTWLEFVYRVDLLRTAGVLIYESFEDLSFRTENGARITETEWPSLISPVKEIELIVYPNTVYSTPAYRRHAREYAYEDGVHITSDPNSAGGYRGNRSSGNAATSGNQDLDINPVDFAGQDSHITVAGNSPDDGDVTGAPRPPEKIPREPPVPMNPSEPSAPAATGSYNSHPYAPRQQAPTPDRTQYDHARSYGYAQAAGSARPGSVVYFERPKPHMRVKVLNNPQDVFYSPGGKAIPEKADQVPIQQEPPINPSSSSQHGYPGQTGESAAAQASSAENLPTQSRQVPYRPYHTFVPRVYPSPVYNPPLPHEAYVPQSLDQQNSYPPAPVYNPPLPRVAYVPQQTSYPPVPVYNSPLPRVAYVSEPLDQQTSYPKPQRSMAPDLWPNPSTGLRRQFTDPPRLGLVGSLGPKLAPSAAPAFLETSTPSPPRFHSQPPGNSHVQRPDGLPNPQLAPPITSELPVSVPPVFMWPIDHEKSSRKKEGKSTTNTDAENIVHVTRGQEGSRKGKSVQDSKSERILVPDTNLQKHETAATILDDVGRSLKQDQGVITAKLYDKLPLSNYDKISKTLVHQDSMPESHRRQKLILELAQEVLGFFVPLDIFSEVPLRYWGAVELIIKDINQGQPKYEIDTDRGLDRPTSSVEILLNNVAQTAKEIRRGVSSNDPEYPSSYCVPVGLVQAFKWLLKALILYGAGESNTLREALEADRKCDENMQEAVFQLLTMLRLGDYSNGAVFECVGPQALLGLILENLSCGLSEKVAPTDEDQYHILNYYLKQFNKLQLQLQKRPRRHLLGDAHNISQELAMVQEILSQEYQCLNPVSSPYTQQYSIGNTSYDSCKEIISSQMRWLSQLQENVRDTTVQIIQLLDVNKDSNDKAIFAFTTVTVIFLPLSFVTSYLGMNTADLRDMTHGQAVYWGAALPVTFVTVIVTFFIAFKWEKIVDTIEEYGDWLRRRTDGQN